MNPILVSVRGISKGFIDGDSMYEVLKGISLEIRPGEIVGLLGRSGCGKSTLLNIVAGLDVPDEGSVGLHPAVGSRIAYAIQGAVLVPWRTTRGNVALALELSGKSTAFANAAATDALSAVGMQESLHLLPAQLSGGMKQKVSLARAIVTRPLVMLLDEPFSEIDASGRQHLIRELRTRIATPAGPAAPAAVVVTHSLEDAMALCDRILVLGGRPTSVLREVSEVQSSGADGPRIISEIAGVMGAAIEASKDAVREGD